MLRAILHYYRSTSPQTASLQVRHVLNEENLTEHFFYWSFYYFLYINGHIYFIDSFWQVKKLPLDGF